MRTTKLQFAGLFATVALCMSVASCAQFREVTGINRCDRPSDIGKIGDIKSGNSCFQARCIAQPWIHFARISDPTPCY